MAGPTLVEVAFTGKMADKTVKQMGALFAKDNMPTSSEELQAKLRASESQVGLAIVRLRDDMEVMVAKMDHENPIKVEGKTRIVAKYNIKPEYINELKTLFLRKDIAVTV
ncbi:MAG TPA: hypothetical protein VMV00_02515 [Candidatus Baltobacteraceae bacterium]|nr:hypothetical protein [Candidatus Baltobacteraceae bacterium]